MPGKLPCGAAGGLAFRKILGEIGEMRGKKTIFAKTLRLGAAGIGCKNKPFKAKMNP